MALGVAFMRSGKEKRERKKRKRIIGSRDEERRDGREVEER